MSETKTDVGGGTIVTVKAPYVQQVENELTIMRNRPQRGDVLILTTGRIRYCVTGVTPSGGVNAARLRTLREPNEHGLMETMDLVHLPGCVWRDLFSGAVSPGSFDVEAFDALRAATT